MENKNKFTPGPWSVGFGIVEKGKEFPNDWKRCGITKQEGSPFIAVVDFEERGMAKDEQQANARLISACPDMLEALQIAWSFLLGCGAGESETFSVIHRAISKALA